MNKKDWKTLSEDELKELWVLYDIRQSLALTKADWERLKELSEKHYAEKRRQHDLSLMQIVSEI